MLRWTHSPQYFLQGIGSALHLRIPLYCMQKGELLHVKSIFYANDELQIAAEIFRQDKAKPFVEHEQRHGSPHNIVESRARRPVEG